LFSVLVIVMGDVLVSSKEEVDSSDISSVKPVDLNDFFDGDGKIYGYQGLKVMWPPTIRLFCSFLNFWFRIVVVLF